MKIDAKQLFFSYNKEHTLENISFTIEQGDFVALIGPNGAGKTTLLKILLGEIQPSKGTITINKTTPNKQTRKKIAYVPQKAKIDQLFPGTVEEILNLEKEAIVCDELNTKKLHKKQFKSLSGGEQQRVLIELALKTNPELLILDEPTTGVDQQTEKQFYNFLAHLNKEHNITIILVTHDTSVVPVYAKTVLCLNNSICCHGPSKDTKKLLKKLHSNAVRPHHA